MLVDVILDRDYETSYVPAFQTTYICDNGELPIHTYSYHKEATCSAPYESGGFHHIGMSYNTMITKTRD